MNVSRFVGHFIVRALWMLNRFTLASEARVVLDGDLSIISACMASL